MYRVVVNIIFNFLIFVLAAQQQDDESFVKNPRYVDSTELQLILLNIVSRYPHIAAMYSIGTSVDGRELWVLNIRRDVQQPRPLLMPMVKYVGNIHGDEILGRQMLLYFAEYLVTNYNANTEVKHLVDTTDLHILPSMNPDGFERGPKYLCHLDFVTEGRANSHRIDLNRDFPNRVTSPAINITARQPETQAIIRWVMKNPFVLSANFHGGAVVASYPYDNGPNGTSIAPDNDFLKHIALTYARNHLLMHTGHNCDLGEVFDNGITRGAEWYELDGGMQDFNYGYSNCFEITLEISCCKGPHHKELPQEWRNNKRSLIEYIKQVNRGIRGIVIDRNTGNAIHKAEIVVQGRSKAMKTSVLGEYWRLLMPGTYKMFARAHGYRRSRMVKVVIPSEGFLVHHFKLKPV